LLESRLAKRHQQIVTDMFSSFKTSILSITKQRANQIGTYRFLRNERVTEKVLITEIQNRCSKAVKGKTVCNYSVISYQHPFNASFSILKY
jgi:hypothetical protein